MAKRRQTTSARKHRIYVRDHGICHYCAEDCRPFSLDDGKRADDAATLDHIRMVCEGGSNADQNLVLACHRCNNERSCIPYAIFRGLRLWNDPKRCREIRRIFCVGAQSVREHKKSVWLLEMYVDKPVQTVQNYGVFATEQGVHDFIARVYPQAVRNEDDTELGYVGYHFPEDHVLADMSFVANAWDLQ